MKKKSLFLALAFILYGISTSSTAQDFSLVGGTIISGTGDAPIPDAVVNIKNGRIVGVGLRSTVTPFERVIDASGKWILPGLIDAHVHFSQSGGLYTRPDVIDLRHVRSFAKEQAWIQRRLPFTLSSYLCSGVTSVADVGGPFWTLELASLSRQDKSIPRVLAAGPLLTNYVPPELVGIDSALLKITSDRHARASVKNIARRGADFIKLWIIDTGNLSRSFSIFKAAIDQAHKEGLRVFAHATELRTAKLAIKSGVDLLVHAIDDRPIDKELLNLIKKHNIITVSTLAVDEGYSRVLSHTAIVSDFMRKCGDLEVIKTWDELPSHLRQRPSRENRILMQNIKRMVDEGLIVAAGSDAGNIGTLHGPGIHLELELLAKAGLKPMQIIMSATKHGAHVLSKFPEVGTIEDGKIADLLIVRDDPLVDIGNLQKIEHVIRAGKVVN